MLEVDPVYPPLRHKARRGFHGYPVGTVAFYGPTDSRASKVAVGVIPSEGSEASEIERWSSSTGDIRRDPSVGDAVLQFLRQRGVATVLVTNRIIGCPHEEGVDYPEGQPCPQCPFWANRERWSGELIT